MKKYGQVISKLRKEKGLTQEQLGKKLNVSYQAVSKWENNLSEPDLDTIQRLVDIFGITIADFFSMAEKQITIDTDAIINFIDENKNKKQKENTTQSEQFSSGTNKSNAKFKKKLILGISIALAVIVAIVSVLAFLNKPVNTLSQDEIYNKYDSYVFNVSNSNNNAQINKTGFLLNSQGKALVRHSAINGATTASVTFNDGNTYEINKVLSYNPSFDIAIVEIDMPDNLSIEPIENSTDVTNNAYIIYYNTTGTEIEIVKTKVTKSIYNLSGNNYIETEYSSEIRGGLVVNEYGNVIGLTLGKMTISSKPYTTLTLPIERVLDMEGTINLSLKDYTLNGKSMELKFMVDGEEYRSYYALYKNTRELPENPSKTGYIFDGWYIDNDFNKEFTSSTVVDDNFEIHAKFSPIRYSIILSSSVGIGQNQKTEVIYDQDFTFPDEFSFENEGHIIDYWVNANNSNDKKEVLDTVQNLSAVDGEELTYIAVWKPEEYIVTFLNSDEHAGFNNIESSYTYKYTDNSFIVPQPNSPYYDFIGWTGEGITTPVMNVIISDKAEFGDKIYTAHWTPKVFTITYAGLGGGNFVNGETQVVSYTYPEGVTLPTVSREYHDFVHWQVNNAIASGQNSLDKVNQPYSVGGNLNLTAVWQEVLYSLEIKDKQENVVKTVTYGFSKLPTLNFQVISSVSSTIKYLPNYYHFDYGVYLDKEYENKLSDDYTSLSSLNIDKPQNISIYLNIVKATEGLEIVYERVYGGYVRDYTGTSTTVYIPDYIVDNNDIIREVKVLRTAFRANQTIKEVYIANTILIDYYSDHMFYNCQNLETVVLSKQTDWIAPNAFRSCHSLENIIIPDGTTIIGDTAFIECTSLISITIPTSVTYIRSQAFRHCTNLEEVILPNTLSGIGYKAFSGTKFINNPDNYIDGAFYYGSYLLAFNDNLATEYEVKENTKFIAGAAFDFEGNNLEKIILPNSMTKIDAYAFYNCKKLTEVVYDKENLTDIGGSAFDYCDSIKTFYVGGKMTEIGLSAFSHFTGLEEIYIDKSITLVSNYAFQYCENLKSVYYYGSKTEFEEIEISNYYETNKIFIEAQKYFYSNVYIEGQNSWVEINEQTAIWLNETQISINGIIYERRDTQPVEEGNYWFVGGSGEIELWAN